MKIGVAIPCYIGHISNLYILLDSINQQTRIPDKVAVSCSSTLEKPVFPQYKFEFVIIIDSSIKNTAMNRNISAKQLEDMDIISFIDADDIMHPERIECIENAFTSHECDIVLHNSEMKDVNSSLKPFDTCNIYYNTLHRSGGMLVHNTTPEKGRGLITHGHVSVKTKVYNYIRFNESDEFVTKADCVFCWYVFSISDIKHAYISNKLSLYVPSGSCNFRVWCFWLGGYEMSEQRKKCFETIQQNIGVQPILITDHTLDKYILEKHPFHEGYKYLSGVTKCDYVRAYFMHFYGGGYTDIKTTTNSWLSNFIDLYKDDSKWVCGYSESSPGGVAILGSDESEIQEQLKLNWNKLVGNGSFICKSNTKFTQDWFNNLHKLMDKLLPDLKASPAKHQRDCLDHYINGSPSKFPIRWAQIAGCIFHPLCLKYSENILNTLPPPSFHNYI